MEVGQNVGRGQDPTDDVGELLVQLGLAMTAAGEQVDAIQDRLYRVAAANGVPDVEVIVLPTTMLIELGSGARAHVRLGVPGAKVPRLDQVSELYELVGDLERGEVGVAAARARLDALLDAPPRYGRIVRILGYAILSGGLSLLLQPAWGGLVAAIILGAAVGALTTLRFSALATVLPVLASFLVAVCVFVSADHLDADNPIRTLIPPLVMFLPGALLTTGTVELSAGQVISGSTRLVQGLVVLGMMAFGVVAAAELVGAPSAHLLDQPFDRLGGWAPWVGLLAVAIGQWLHYCAPVRTIGPILVVLVIAYLGQLLGSALFGASVSGFFGAAAMTPIVLWMSDQPWGPPKMVTFLPGFWLLVPGAAGLIGATEIVGTDSHLGVGDFSAAITTIFSIALGILVSSAFYTSSRVGFERVTTLGASVRRRWR